MTAFFVPAEPNLDWSSPQGLTTTALRNYLLAVANPYLHPIGHSVVSLHCPRSQRERTIWAAVTGGSNRGDLERLLFDGLGAGILLMEFDGRLQEGDEAKEVVSRRVWNGKARWIRAEISDEACVRAISYYRFFKTNRVYRRFRADYRPLNGNGSGCAGFVLSFFEVIGVSFDYKDFSREIRIPLNLFSTSSRRVSVWSLMLSSRAREWSRAGEESVMLSIIDPSEVYKWIGNHSDFTKGENFLSGIEKSGVNIDARDVPLPDISAFPIFTENHIENLDAE
ncbi:hypothetical protein EU800_23235 [Tropicimonas sp. IMCC6043]|nr:hypothetical protein EU800_23235 [Tropicimonas sp. IMCC6043]